MSSYQVWAEGYAATGESGKATFFGEVDAPSFAAACAKVFDKPHHSAYFNAEALTYWGCHLFDNEKAARRAYG